MVEINLVDLIMFVVGNLAGGFLLLQFYFFDEKAAAFLIMLFLCLPMGAFVRALFKTESHRLMKRINGTIE